MLHVIVANEEPVLAEKRLGFTGINVQLDFCYQASIIYSSGVGEYYFFKAGALGPCLGISRLGEISNLNWEEMEGVSSSTWSTITISITTSVDCTIFHCFFVDFNLFFSFL
jgi:hypothetical protein